MPFQIGDRVVFKRAELAELIGRVGVIVETWTEGPYTLSVALDEDESGETWSANARDLGYA